MLRAYIKTDPLENPEILGSLFRRLLDQHILPITTEKDWREIYDLSPFLYFRHPYLRFDNEFSLLLFHHQHPEIPYIITKDHEIVSICRAGLGNSHPFNSIASTYLQEPSVSPLPILMGTHQRPLYFRLALNSILHTTQSFSKQKYYLVLSQPDPETLKIVEDLLKTNPRVEAVLAQNNLKYSFANFGTKFFNLAKFIHHEDDGIVPENINYHLPFWTSQLHYRSMTAGLAALRVFEGNWTYDFWKSSFLHRRKEIIPRIAPGQVWSYLEVDSSRILPIGGHGVVTNSEKVYKDFRPPGYHTSDGDICQTVSTICIANVPVYHIGANYKMDYPDYSQKKVDSQVDRFQIGKDLRTGQSKKIDLGLDWKDPLNAKIS